MITKQATINGTNYILFPKCQKDILHTHWGKANDVAQNSDGSYSIAGAEDPRNSEPFIAMDTGEVFVYDEEGGVWWKM